MKRFGLIIVLLLTLAVGCKGDLYQRYANRPGITVAEIVGFRLSDTEKVDVVVLEAVDSATWQELKTEYDIRTDQGVTSWIGEVDAPATRTRWNGTTCCKVIASHERRTLCLYTIKNKAQYEALLEYQFNKLEN